MCKSHLHPGLWLRSGWRELDRLLLPALRNPGLSAAGAAPAKRGRAVGAPEGPHEVARLPVANPPANLLNRKVALDQQTTRLCHAPLGDPLLHRASRLAPDYRGEVPWREAHRSRHVPQTDGFVVAILYEAKDLGEQWLIL